MSKNVTGATGCSAVGVTPLNLFVSKYEAFKRNESKASSNENSQGNAAESGGSGSSASTNSGSPVPTSKASSAESGSSAVGNSAVQNSNATDDAVEMCTVTYMSGGKEYARQEVEKGKNVKYSIGELPDSPNDERAEFHGWWLEEKVGEKKTAFTASTRVKEDMTIYAKWIRVICHYVDNELIDRREVEIKSPDVSVHATFKLKTDNNGDIDGWRSEQEGVQCQKL